MLAITNLKYERGVKRLMEKSYTDGSTGQSIPVMSSIYDGSTTSEDTCSNHQSSYRQKSNIVSVQQQLTGENFMQQSNDDNTDESER